MEFFVKPFEKIITVNSFVDAIDAIREPGFVFAGEMHDFWEVVFVENGFVTASAEEQVYNLCAGQIIFHKPNEFHRIRTNGKNPAHLLIISFESCGTGMEEFEKKCYTLTQSEIEEYTNMFFALQAACESYDGKEMDNILAAKASNLLEGFLLGLKNKNSVKKIEYSQNEKRYKEIVTIMKEHCDEWLNICDIAALCHMSPSNVKRIFSLYCDMGISKYFLTLKLRKACEMLLEGVSISEVSSALGFCSVNYFHTVFKREIGVTPNKYTLEK